jgi:hypothetical protein
MLISAMGPTLANEDARTATTSAGPARTGRGSQVFDHGSWLRRASLSVDVRTVSVMAIARYPSFVIDCPDAGVLASFYGTLLDWNVKTSDGWGEIRADGQCICFQQVENFTAPEWPGQDVPQQMHLDVIVEDLDTAEAAVLELGATKHGHQPGTSFRVFLDPAGHPFCLCVE